MSPLARTAENLDSALARADLSAPGRHRQHHVETARQYLARIVADATRRIDELDTRPEARQ